MVCGGSCDLLLLNLNPTRPGRSHRTEGAASGDSTSSRLLWAERTAVALPIYLTPLPQPQPGPPLRPHSPVAHPQSSTGTRRSPRAAAHSQADCRTADDLAGPVYGLVSIKMAKRKKERKKKYEFYVHLKKKICCLKDIINADVPTIFFVLLYELSISSVQIDCCCHVVVFINH